MKQFFKFMFASMLGFFLSCFLMMFLSLIFIAALVSISDKETSIPSKSVLLIKLDEPIQERSQESPFTDIPFRGFQYLTTLGLDDIIKDIKKAEKDPKIEGILLDINELMIGYATTEEIREALLDFKKSGKFIYSYSDFYTQKSYYLASASDKVFLNPLGELEWKGLDASIMFYKGLLEKLDIEVQVVRHGKFKSAVEPLITDKMSPENRQQITTFIQSIWDQLANGVSKSRKLTVDELNRIADTLAIEKAEDAVSRGLVDSLIYREGLLKVLQKKLALKEDEKVNYVGLRKYNDIPVKEKKESTRDKIAVVFASGDIIQGEGDESTIGAERISRAIRKARTNKNVKAIVLRINSPGGMMISSDIIWREIQLARKEKPVVASFGDYAASGGYYIGCEADKIVAQPTTLTGSIGVFGIIPNFQKTMNNKLGITIDEAMTHKNSDFISVFKPMSDYQKALLTRSVERSYGIFVDRVAKGRKLDPALVDSLGQGRVWTGTDAKRLGLVDEIGGLQKAVEIAAGLAKIKNYRLMSLPEMQDPFTQIIEQLSGDYPEEAYLKAKLGPFYSYYEQLKVLQNLEGVQARMPFSCNIR